MFYNYRQNNSGGSFTLDEKKGISCNVIIEAKSSSHADEIAQRLGIYFDGCENGGDCPCCGDRWYPARSSEESTQPEIYGELVVANQNHPADQGRNLCPKWMDEGKPEGYIHYLDGRVEGFHQFTDARTDLNGSFGWGVAFNRFSSSVFLVGENGYDETGNQEAASKTKREKGSFPRWTKPDKPTVHYYEGYGRAWFPTEAEAVAFAVETAKHTEEMIKAIKEAKVPKDFTKIWLG